MFYSQYIKQFNTINNPAREIPIEEGDLLALKGVDKSKGFDGSMYFEIIVFRRRIKECYTLWCRTDELDIRLPVSYRIFEDGVPYIYVEREGELIQMKSVRLQ